MTEVKPATDEQIATMPQRFAAPRYLGGGVDVGEAFSLLARIQSDREEIVHLKAEVAEWEAKAANWLASPEAAARLEGYRSLGMRVADAENARDTALSENARLKAEVERLKANVERRIANSPLPRCPHCQGYGTCECGTSTSCHVCLGTGRAR